MKKTSRMITESKKTTTNTKGEITMKKTSKIRTRILAAALSAVTIFSVSAMTVTTASAAAPPAMVGTVLKYMAGQSFGYAKDSVMKLAGPELSKMGLSPILNMVLGIECMIAT